MNLKILDEKKYTPIIKISENAYRTISSLAEKCDSEIGWLMLCHHEPNTREYYIYDTLMCKQRCTGTHTELDEKALSDLYEDCMKDNIDVNEIRVWGHSHVNMSTSSSTQDDKTFEEYYKNCEYFIRLIINKKGEYNLSLADNAIGVIYEGLNLSIANSNTRSKLLSKIKKAEEKLAEYDKNENEYYLGIADKLVEDNVILQIKKTNNKSVSKFTNKSYTTPTYSYSWDEDDYWDWKYKYNMEMVLQELPTSIVGIRDGKEITKIDNVFTTDEIDAISDCCSLNEVKTLINNITNLKDYYSDEEINNIWKNCTTIVEECYRNNYEEIESGL